VLNLALCVIYWKTSNTLSNPSALLANVGLDPKQEDFGIATYGELFQLGCPLADLAFAADLAFTVGCRALERKWDEKYLLAIHSGWSTLVRELERVHVT
jgi:hypothetical protein